MTLLKEVQRGKVAAPRRVLLYGTHGIGKSTFGSMAERPIFIQTEDGLGGIDCERFPLAEKFEDVLAAMAELYTGEHDYRTVVVDSLVGSKRSFTPASARTAASSPSRTSPTAKGTRSRWRAGARCSVGSTRCATNAG